MYSWNQAFRAATMITVSLIGLSGCGSGSTSSAVSTTTVTATTSSTVQVPDNIPDTPTGVSAVGGTNKITLSWNAVTGAASYSIYWSAVPGVATTTGTRIDSTGTFLIQRGLPPLDTRYYIVTSRNKSGESGVSAQVFAGTAALDGAAPYNTFCAVCHGSLITSTVTSGRVTAIKTAIQNINLMNDLTLTDAQITAISAALMDNN